MAVPSMRLTGSAISMQHQLNTKSSPSFVDRHELWNAEQEKAARDIIEQMDSRKLDVVRFSFPDQHGILRGKTLTSPEIASALRCGVTIPTSIITKDTAHRSVFPVFAAGGGFDMPEMQGASDMLMVADPLTFRVLPWAPNAGWVLCDTYFPDGTPVPFTTRHLLRRALQKLDEAGFDLVTGLEVEFHVFRLLDPHLGLADTGQPGRPPDVELLSRGYQYLTETRFDQVEPVIELLRRQLATLGLPIRSLEVEYGPSQFEFTLSPTTGITAADSMVLFRSAVKQICRRNGYHATFMCRPRVAGAASSGWHLHQSLTRKSDGCNAFAGEGCGAVLSPLGQRYLAGLLVHATAATALSTPTINGYKRYRPYELAPDRVSWGHDNRGALIRVIEGATGEATRLENRVGEPAANPYLYLASQIHSGLDGVNRKLEPGPPCTTPYELDAVPLPKTLSEALAALRRDECLCTGLGTRFVDYYCRVKEAEIARFNMEVTEWEQREYFELF